MTTQEKLIKILADGWEIKIYARDYPTSDAIQGYLPKHRIYTSEKEGEVFIETPFCIGYFATKGDQTLSEICSTFDIFIDILYKNCNDRRTETIID